jgi:hypothetical protein
MQGAKERAVRSRRPRRRGNDSSDRAFRALSRAEPARIAALLRAVAPGLLPAGKRITPAHVDDPHLDANPCPLDGDFAARVGRRDLLHAEFQSYRDRFFPQRVFRYHLGFVERYPDRIVHSVAFWILRPPISQRRDEIEIGDVRVRITTVVLPEIPAAALLEPPAAACFAAGANAGEWTADELCRRVVQAMVREGATWNQWRVAGVVAAAQGRYNEFMKAMGQARVEPVIITDLVEYGEDLGYRRGRREGLKQGREFGREEGREEGVQQGLRRALLATYEARFGATPPSIEAAVEAMRDEATLVRWQGVFSTRTAASIAAALRPSSARKPR